MSRALPGYAPLAIATRGGEVESVHYGSVAVVDASGKVIASFGDPYAITFTRSALKPLQALPFIRAGGPARFGFGQQEIALMCASHSGEARHTALSASMLAAIGCTEADLQCGVHPPLGIMLDARAPRPDAPLNQLIHNCSGKHAGMLAYCKQHGLPTSNYLAMDHPLQVAIRAGVAEVTATPNEAIVAGIDGCSAPNYAVPLAGLALAFLRIAQGSDPALRQLGEAMAAYPELVSGTGRNDAALMQAGKGDWVTKVGAEGVQAIGVKSRGIGIAIKVADGNARALFPATVEVMDQLGLLDDEARRALHDWHHPKISNYKRTEVGTIETIVKLG